jgi:acetyl esterase/lipase
MGTVMASAGRLLLLLIALAVLFLAVQSRGAASSRLGWQLGVLVTELGHWFVLFVLVLVAALVLGGGLRQVLGRVTLAALLVSIPLLLRPIGLALRHRYDDATEGLLEGRKRLSFRQLFVGTGLKRVPFERVEVPSGDAARVPLTLDLYRSTRGGPSPLVVVIHGGGWDSGDSEQLPELNWRLARNGYTVAAVSYRLAPGAQWPAQRDDILAAVDHLLGQGEGLGIDRQHWFLLGRSAGGQLAGVVGYERARPGLRGVILFYAPTDLAFGYEVADPSHWLRSRTLLEQVLGGKPLERPLGYADASPLAKIDGETVPTLVIHGRPDSLSWYKHAERLQTRLEHLHRPVFYLDLPWAQHGFDWSLNGPGGQASTAAVLAFLERYSKGASPG